MVVNLKGKILFEGVNVWTEKYFLYPHQFSNLILGKLLYLHVHAYVTLSFNYNYKRL